MGRSTTLAYLAYFYYLLGKKIVVFDFDFEAPGISSLFFEKGIREKKAGILDYLIDINLEDNLKLENYFLQNEVSNNSGNLYINHFQRLLDDVNIKLKPDLIFIDLRAGINESNGYILKNLSNKNLLFFNSEEQNEDGLKVILNSLSSLDNSIILNSTIRYSDSETKIIKETQTNISTMDNWIISQLSDGKGNITPRVIYKFLFESIEKELGNDNLNSNPLLKFFSTNYKDILLSVSKHRLIEYDEEYKDYNQYYKVIQSIGYRIFEYKEYRESYNRSQTRKNSIKKENIDGCIKKLIDSGFISIKDEKAKIYQVANVYVPALDIKMNRQGRRKI